MSVLLTLTLCLVLVSVFNIPSVYARRVNITLLDNCQDLEPHEKPTIILTKVSYHISPEDGLCDIVHGNVAITTLDTEPLHLTMTLFKCEESILSNGKPCLEIPTTHEELLDCHRLLHDDSGPWHMFTSSMDEGQCGDQVGDFPLSFARLRLEHLMKYLDVYDATYNSFRLKMYFKSTQLNTLRGCEELDFTLIAT